jgi:hypothetical protein
MSILHNSRTHQYVLEVAVSSVTSIMFVNSVSAPALVPCCGDCSPLAFEELLGPGISVGKSDVVTTIVFSLPRPRRGVARIPAVARLNLEV